MLGSQCCKYLLQTGGLSIIKFVKALILDWVVSSLTGRLHGCRSQITGSQFTNWDRHSSQRKHSPQAAVKMAVRTYFQACVLVAILAAARYPAGAQGRILSRQTLAGNADSHHDGEGKRIYCCLQTVSRHSQGSEWISILRQSDAMPLYTVDYTTASMQYGSKYCWQAKLVKPGLALSKRLHTPHN